MAVATAPRSRRSLIGLALDAARGAQRASGRFSQLAAAARDHMTTFAAFAAVDVGLLHYGAAVALIGAGVSLLLLEFKVRG